MLRARILNLLTFAILALAGSGVSAQGLIFHLPDDGKMVEYEGTLTQGTSADDESPLTWTCQLTIKSVGKEDAPFQGENQPCRWLEIKVLTGNSGAAGLDPGPWVRGSTSSSSLKVKSSTSLWTRPVFPTTCCRL